MEEKQVMTEREIKIVKNSTLYELRLLFTADDKEQYTKDEILKVLDQVARAKEQE